MEANNVHGQKGVYRGGEWLNIEECHKITSSEKCSSNCDNCPNAQNVIVDSKSTEIYDVVIVGAGCIGSSIARELIKNKLKVCLIEKSNDVSQGATKGNSGIVHAGYDDKHGSVRSKLCWKGNQMFANLDRELKFGFQLTGSLVVAKNQTELAVLHELIENGKKNGVKNLRILDQKELREVEPHIAPDCIAALYSPDAGIVTPYEFTIAVAENAVDNGVQVLTNCDVTNISGQKGNYLVSFKQHIIQESASNKQWFLILALLFLSLGIGYYSMTIAVVAAVISIIAIVIIRYFGLMNGKTTGAPLSNDEKSNTPQLSHNFVQRLITSRDRYNSKEIEHNTSIHAKYVVNCAGLYADKISGMVNDKSFEIKPRVGEYLLLNKNQGHLARHVIFPCPGPMGKGTVVQPTLWGNLLLGPTAREIHLAETALETSDQITKKLILESRKLIPDFDSSQVIHSFAGARAKSSTGDWIIRESEIAAGFINVAGIDSPGLAGSPAIALEVIEILKRAGLNCVPNPSFNPYRRAIIIPKNGWTGGLSLKSTDPNKRVVCKCELVTEAEIVDSIHRSLPINDTQAVRKRTRAGMGHCQGTYCEEHVKAILSRELKKPIDSIEGRPWPESSLLPRRWLTEEDKLAFGELK